MYATGARVSEAVGLVVDDVRADEILDVITLTGKGNKQRVVPVGRFAREALDAIGSLFESRLNEHENDQES
jgi:integrase/recombinase XerD